MDKKLVETITARDKDFAQWYTDLCIKAELMDYSDAKGFIIYRPYGYAIWENIQKYLDQRFKEHLSCTALYNKGKYKHQTKLYKAILKYGKETDK